MNTYFIFAQIYVDLVEQDANISELDRRIDKGVDKQKDDQIEK